MTSRLANVWLAACAAAALTACGGGGDAPPPMGAAPTPPVAAPPAPVGAAPPPATTAPRCDGGTDYGAASTIASPTTWSAAGSPHRGGTVTLLDTVLTIEAGSVVCVNSIEGAAGGFPQVHALGTSRSPVRLHGTALRVVARLEFVQGSNMPAVGTPLRRIAALTDSSFAWIGSRDPGLCAQVVVGDSGGGGGATLRRVTIVGYGSIDCAALALIDPENAWGYDAVPIEVRVTGSIGDAIAVAPTINPAETIAFVNCELSSNGRHGIVVPPHPQASWSWVTASGCNFFANGGFGLVNQSAGVLTARGNWWGHPAGPAGPGGDGVSSQVDAGQPAAAAFALGY